MTPSEFATAEGVEDWRILGDGATVFYATSSLAESARLVDAIAKVPAVDDHPPAIDVRPGGVTIRLVTFVEGHGGMTERDLEIARHVTQLAHDLGLTADPSAVQSLLVVPGARDIGAVTPFWRAVLGYQPRADSPEEDLVDPQDRTVPIWFETMEELRPGNLGAIHVAVWVPVEQAEARIAAALEAGGHVVRDTYKPAWVTLADAAGNEVDVATISGRG
jgi:4a-hydroxytetrahydrobiopterin dehydratase